MTHSPTVANFIALKPRRRWFQFRLRTLLVGVALVGAACGYVAREWRIVAERMDWLRYHPQLDHIFGSRWLYDAHLPWIRRMLGDKLHENIEVSTGAEQEAASKLFPESRIWIEEPVEKLFPEARAFSLLNNAKK